MSTTHKDGGYAFPGYDAYLLQPGMTLRDWFAGQIASSVISTKQVDRNHNGMMPQLAPPIMEFDPQTTACKAYAFADAMIAAREKGAQS